MKIKRTEQEAKQSAVRVLLETLDVMGYRNIRRIGNKVIAHKYLPHLGRKRCWVKHTFRITKTELQGVEGNNPLERRNMFEESIPRQIKEIDND